MEDDKLKILGAGLAMGVMMIGLGVQFLRGKVDMPRHRVLGDISIPAGIFFIIGGLIIGGGMSLMALRPR